MANTINFSIRVVDEDGNPLEGISVWVADKAFFSSGNITEYTDEDGWTEFSFYNYLDSYIDAKVCVDNNEMMDYFFNDGDTTSFTISGK